MSWKDFCSPVAANMSYNNTSYNNTSYNNTSYNNTSYKPTGRYSFV